MENDKLSDIEERCLNGVCVDNNYAMVIRSIRTALRSIKDSPDAPKGFDCTDGGIVFYSSEKYPNEEFSDLKINVFPLCSEKARKKLPLNIELREAVLQKINAERPYSDLYHIDLFQEKSDTIGHMFLNISEHDMLIKKRITKDKTEGLEFEQQGKPFFKSWEEIINNIETFESSRGDKVELGKHHILTNTLDFAYFNHKEVKDKNLLLIPIPAISVPVILIVIPRPFQNKKKNVEFCLKIRQLLQGTVYNYLGDRIVRKLTNEEELKNATRPESFLAKFLEEVSEVLLPKKCSYSIDGLSFEKTVFKTNDWNKTKSTNPKNTQDFELNLEYNDFTTNTSKSCKAEFELVDFVYKLDASGNEVFYNSDDKEVFENELEMLQIRLSNLYKLVYDKWESLKFQNERIDIAYKKTVNSKLLQYFGKKGDSLEGLFEAVAKIPSFIKDIKNIKPSKESKSNENIEFTFGFSKAGRDVEFYFDSHKPIMTSKMAGFYDLAQLIEDGEEIEQEKFFTYQQAIKSVSSQELDFETKNEVTFSGVNDNTDQKYVMEGAIQQFNLLKKSNIWDTDNLKGKVACLNTLNLITSDLYSVQKHIYGKSELIKEVAKKHKSVVESIDSVVLDTMPDLKDSLKQTKMMLTEFRKELKKFNLPKDASGPIRAVLSKLKKSDERLAFFIQDTIQVKSFKWSYDFSKWREKDNFPNGIEWFFGLDN